MSSINLDSATLGLVMRLGAELALTAIQNHRNKSLAEMTDDEVRTAVRELLVQNADDLINQGAGRTVVGTPSVDLDDLGDDGVK